MRIIAILLVPGLFVSAGFGYIRLRNELVGLQNARLLQLPWSLVAQGLEARSFYEPPADELTEPELAL